MKQFFKIMFASMLGTILVAVIGFFILLGVFAGIAALGKQETVQVKDQSILVIKLENPIVERGIDHPRFKMDFGSFDQMKTTGLNDILKHLKRAKEDPRIRGVYLELTDISAGWATLFEIRKALSDFKTSGKFIYAYAENIEQRAYYMGSVADKIYMNKEGMLMFNGLASEVMFFKGALDKLGVEMQIIRHGKFKSAVEPFFLDKMSPENRQQIRSYVNGIWNTVVADIAKSRGLSENEVNRIADDLLATFPSQAIELKMIDGVYTKFQMDSVLNTLVKTDANSKYASVNLDKYIKETYKKAKKEYAIKDQVAVIYAQGEIHMGKGDGESIGSVSLSEAINKAAKDEEVKAIVLRVNSPGGDALASEIILNALEKAKEKKPVVASFGDYAASGGYYIACLADKIFTDPTTLTGSIGVFGVIPNAKKLISDKVGVTIDTVVSNKNASFMSIFRPMSSGEARVMQSMVEQVYSTFVNHVSAGRNMTFDQVDSIGQGRVWCGVDAKRIGLVDEFGGLNDAIAEAAKMANIKEYKLTEYPEQKDFITELMETFGNVRVSRLKAQLGEFYPMYEAVQKLTKEKGVQARMPFEIKMN